MATPYVGEIRLFAGTFAPVNFALCNGQVQSISQNEALFALIGTTYGGDGQQTFALPDLQGRVPIHFGQGNGLPAYSVGERGGAETVTLTTAQIPVHRHTFSGTTQGTSVSPSGKLLSTDPGGNIAPYNTASNGATMNALALANAGSSQPHNNLQPFLAISYIISLFGIFPEQS